jgi:hypothetical protein
MDSFMFGNRPAPPMKRNALPTRIQQLNPANLMRNPQISKGLDGFSGILNNVQHVLQIVETTTPIIKEYGPMVKNLPAMYRMVKAFSELESDEKENQHSEQEKGQEDIEKKEVAVHHKTPNEGSVEETSMKGNKSKRSGVSTPKLYL